MEPHTFASACLLPLTPPLLLACSPLLPPRHSGLSQAFRLPAPAVAAATPPSHGAF